MQFIVHLQSFNVYKREEFKFKENHFKSSKIWLTDMKVTIIYLGLILLIFFLVDAQMRVI